MADPSQQAFLNTLFQWTVKNTSNDNPEDSSTSNDTVQEMDPDKKQWLNEALENITVNPVERIKLCISKLKDDQITEVQKVEFLEELSHWTEELDLAKDFFTVGGLEILTPLLDHLNTSLRCGACILIANLVQNNDHCQRIIVQSGLQEKILRLVDESDNPEVKTKAVTAISALIRGYTLGQLQFQKYQGMKVLIRALSAPIPRLQNKICFLINIVCSSSSQMKKLFYENGALEALVQLANDPSCSDYTNVIQTILTVSSAKKDAFKSLTKKEPELMERFEFILNRKREEILHLDDYRDDVAMLNQIRIQIRSTTDSQNDGQSLPTTPTTPTTSNPVALMLTHNSNQN